MKVAAIEFNVKHEALEIFVSGCSIRCKNCHNPELWNFDYGDEVDTVVLDRYLNNPLVKRVHIMGGEPLDQDLVELEGLLTHISKTKEIWLFTGHSSVPHSLLKHIDYIKIGKYLEEHENTTGAEQYGFKLGSYNQEIVKVDRNEGLWYDKPNKI